MRNLDELYEALEKSAEAMAPDSEEAAGVSVINKPPSRLSEADQRQLETDFPAFF